MVMVRFLTWWRPGHHEHLQGSVEVLVTPEKEPEKEICPRLRRLLEKYSRLVLDWCIMMKQAILTMITLCFMEGA
jgi:hypothetical protein